MKQDTPRNCSKCDHLQSIPINTGDWFENGFVNQWTCRKNNHKLIGFTETTSIPQLPPWCPVLKEEKDSGLPKIEPCPFCLSTKVILNRNFDYVKCLFCGASGHTFDGHPYDVIVTWNSVSVLAQAEEARKSLEIKLKIGRV